ncbi:MAG: cadherin domain-containing protein [Oscillatoria sp. PMC 1051.18]|nr:cadherin domain-containing protein [Oscillatoria sp. PMC 1050.18]MEC5032065.1 cadherin domain-containing protein [Oscillatoria sp. PMC 1051.18]
MAIINGTANGDELFAESTGDELLGLGGDDTLDAAGGSGNNTLRGGAGNDELFAGVDDFLFGDEGDDTLEGRSGSGGSQLDGGEGNDFLFADSDDVLIGGDGSDRLFAGSGDATLTGGTGADQFWLAIAELPTSANIITDFTLGEDVLGIAGLEPDLAEFDDLNITQENGNTVISTTGGTELAILEGFTDELDATDFVFDNQTAENQPPVAEDATFTVAENSAVGTSVGTVTAEDPDLPPDATLSYVITAGNLDPDGDGVNAFTIDPDTGEITVADAGDLDFETTPNFDLEITVTDPENLTDTADITVNLTNVVETVTLESKSENNIFSFAGDEEDVNLKFTVSGDAGFVNEVGLYFVDDAEGTIDGITPGEAGYTQAALERSQTIASLLDNNSRDFFNGDIFSEAQSRILNLDSDRRFGFYLVQNSDTDTVLNALEAGTTPPNVYFGAADNADGFLQLDDLTAGEFTLNWDDSPLGGDADFDDVQVSFEITNEEASLGSDLQGTLDLIDFRSQAGELLRTDIVASQDAALNNRGGLYIVQDTSGSVLDPVTGQLIAPGQAGYREAALANSAIEFDRIDPDTTILPGGFLYAPYLLAGGDEEAAYFAFAEANPGGIDHVRLLDDNTFGFEDTAGGGDLSFNDFVFSVDASVV